MLQDSEIGCRRVSYGYVSFLLAAPPPQPELLRPPLSRLFGEPYSRCHSWSHPHIVRYILSPHTVTSVSVCPITMRVMLRSPVRVLTVRVLPEFPVFVLGFQALYFLQQVHDILRCPNVATNQGSLNSDGVVRVQGFYQVFFRHGWLEVCTNVCVSRVI